ncbi:MAG: hypothetical protein F2934_02530 [Actinobacteria bacterium]|uniref:Unannotated protein n=1 Tax=freshwater metagenome TaxID=449393 RepID=A0A6J6T307_9ZZZZ|nr:hypothetical protein [Actinomycetota bacterium]MTB05991.1 hypothetical protein [Actinomycetota bacterium]
MPAAPTARRCARPIVVAVTAAIALASCGTSSPDPAALTTTAAPASESTSGTTAAQGLPSINLFREIPSNRLPVDTVLIRSGFPFKGKNAVSPHPGAHIVFGTGFEEWPQGGTGPTDYPPIYAVADGIVSRVTDTLVVGENDRYGINLSIATDGTSVIDFEYSIEPMVKEPSPGFYRTFIAVKEGDRVSRGDVIGYMFLPKGSEEAHIHFGLINGATGTFMAPAIFSKETVAEFYGTWKNLGFDGNDGPTNPIPPCIGWKLAAEENPLENRAVDCLTYPAASGA